MPTFQSTVLFDTAFGLPGEFAFDGPQRVEPGILRTTAPANNVFGRVFSMDSAVPGVWRAGDPTVNGDRFAIMVSPKEHVSNGTAVGGSLAPSLVLPNEIVASFCTMGMVWGVTSNAAALVGNIVRFVKLTGELFTVPAGTAANALHLDLPNAVVVRYPQPNAGGLIVVSMTQP